MIFHIFKAQKRSNSGETVQEIVRSGFLLLCTELNLFYIELPENCIYLNQSELINFFMYLIRTIITGDSDWLIVVCFMTVKSMLTTLFFALEKRFVFKIESNA